MKKMRQRFLMQRRAATRFQRRRPVLAVLAVLATIGLAACSPLPSPPTPTPPLAEALTVYTWPDDETSVIIDAFAAEYGVTATRVFYESQEEAIANLQAGKVYDVVLIDNQFLPLLVAEGLLAEIDHRNVPNLKNIAANFRDLAYDPGNRYTIPFSWGTTGLAVRSDLVEAPVARWADLWDPRYAGRVVAWTSTPRYVLGAALVSLGYAANLEDPQELEAALVRLLELKPNAIWLGEEPSSAPLLVSGEAVMAVAWVWGPKTLSAHDSSRLSLIVVM